MKKSVIAALSMCLISTAASADEPYDWTGVTGGIAFGNTHADNVVFVTSTGAPLTSATWEGDPHTSSYFGVNYQHGRVVGGVEFFLSNWNAEAVAFSYAASGTIELRARLGVAFDRLHLYGTAGHAEVFEDLGGVAGTATGHVYGFGVEYAVWENVIIGAEHVVLDMSQEFPAFDNTIDHDQESYRVRLGFRF